MGINEDIGRSVVWKAVYSKDASSDSEVIQKIVSKYVIVNLIANYRFFYNFLMYGSFYLHIRMSIQ